MADERVVPVRRVDHPGDGLADLMAYLDASPSPYHAAASTVARLQAAGSVGVDETSTWRDVPRRGHVVRGGAVVAWVLPGDEQVDAPLRIAGAHTDSPGLRVKPRPDAGALGWRQLGVEVYGGVLLNSWLDRDLALAGRVVHADGTSRLVDVREPVARVPQLAIHLDRGVNDGLKLDPQQHLTPVWGLGTPRHGELADWIAERCGGDAPVWWELCLYDAQPAAVLGADRTLLASGRLDNQVSCWAATTALASTDPADHVAMIVLNDHEEVGSDSLTGAGGPFLEHVVERLVSARGGDRETVLRVLARSACVSADNAHAVHPNYADRHEPAHLPLVGRGPAVKVNANQRYATSAETATSFQRACESAGVPWQVFVSRNNVPCGSTIGPITATRLGIATVDVGVPQLSMHSAREVCGVEDPVSLRRALTAWFTAP